MKFLKALFGTESIVEIVRKVIAVLLIIAASIPGVSVVLKNAIRSVVIEEIAPLKQYVYDDISVKIQKNVTKLQKDPNDVKIEDVESVLNYWPMLEKSDIVNLPVLEQKITILQKWYADNGGKS